MGFTNRQKAAVKAIVSCHETGKAVGNYSALVVLPDDAGITYGCHQSTHKSGSLHKIVKRYCEISTSENAIFLAKYLNDLKNPAKRHTLAKDTALKSALKKAGKEREMQIAQDEVFDENYFKPALQAVKGSGWKSALALAVVYDSIIQGGWTRVRDRVKATDEKDWIAKYVAARRKWLGSSSKKVVRGTVYRMTTFENLIKQGNWDLELPITAHGVKITQSHLETWIAAMADEEKVTRKPKEVAQPAPSTQEAPELLVAEVAVSETAAVPINEVQEIEQVEATPVSGWKTWTTTVTGTLSTLGVSASAFLSWYWGAITDPQSSYFVMLITVTGFAAAALIVMTYMITRAIKQNKREKLALQLTLKEMEIRANPTLGNVTIKKAGNN